MKKIIIAFALVIGLVSTGTVVGYAANSHFNSDSIVSDYTKKIDNFIKEHQQNALTNYVEGRQADLNTEAESYFESSKEEWLEKHGGVPDAKKKEIDKEYEDAMKQIQKSMDDKWKENY